MFLAQKDFVLHNWTKEVATIKNTFCCVHFYWSKYNYVVTIGYIKTQYN
jgi:hypothetical protein